MINPYRSRNITWVKTLSALLGLFAALFVLVSGIFLIHEIRHDCSGEDCPVCAAMEQCEEAVRTLCTGLVILAAVILSALPLLISGSRPSHPVLSCTPVSAKTRINC